MEKKEKTWEELRAEHDLREQPFQLCRCVFSTYDSDGCFGHTDIYDFFHYPDDICDDRTEGGDCTRDGKKCDYKVYELVGVAPPPEVKE